MNPAELVPLKLLIRGFGWPDVNKEMPSGRPALCLPDLGEQIRGVARPYYKRRTGARPSRIHEAAHATPDMPVRKLSGIGPPVRDALAWEFRTGRRLLILHAPSGSTGRTVKDKVSIQEPYGSCWTPWDEDGFKGDLM